MIRIILAAFLLLAGTGSFAQVPGAGGTTRILNGGDVTQGNTNDAPCASGSTTPCTIEQRLAHLENIAAGAIPQGSANIGHVTIDSPVTDITAYSGAPNAAAPSKAVLNGGGAKSSEGAATTTGYIMSFFTDLVGKLVTSPYANRESMWRGGNTSSTTAAITLLAAQGAGIKTYMTDISCTRNDVGTTAISVTLNDSSAMQFDVPDNGGGGGYTHTWNVPLVTAANTALTATPSAGVSTLKCWGTGFTGY